MKLNKKIIVGIIVAVVLVLALACSYVYAKTDLFKSPKHLFYKYLLGECTEFSYDEFLNEYKNSTEKNYFSNGEFTVNINSEDASIEQVAEIVNNLKYTFETKNMPSENKMSTNLKVDYDNKNLVEASILQNGETYGVKSDILYDKYISVENNNLKELAQKFGIDEDAIPDKIEKVDLYELLYVSKEDRNEILDKYKDVVNKSIPKDKYIAEKNAETKINGETIKANAYKITLNEKESLDTIKSILETAKDDDKLKDLIINKYNIVTKNIPEDEKEELSKDNITDAIEEALENIKDEIENLDDDDNAEITVKVFASKGKFVKLEVSSNDNDKIEIQKYVKDDKNCIELISDDETLMKAEYKITKANDTEKVEGTVEINSGYDKTEIEFDINTKGTSGKGKNEIEGFISIKTDDIEIEIKAKETVDFDSKVEVETLNDNNSTKLNNLSENELKELFTDVSENAQNKLPSKLEETGLDKIIEKQSTKNDNLYNSYIDDDIEL